MTVARLISIDTRSGLLVGLGATILFAPLALGLSAAAMVVGIAMGAVAIGLGLAGLFAAAGALQLTLSATTRYSTA